MKKELTAYQVIFWAIISGAVAGSFATLIIALVFMTG